MANEMAKLEILLEAQTASFEKGMQQATRQLTAMNEGVKKQGAQLNAVNAQFKSVTSSIGLMTGALAAVGGLGALKGLLDAADAAADMGDAFGVSIDKVYAYQTMLLATGGKAEGLDKVFQKLSQNMTDALGGSAQMRASFDALGISMEQIKSLSLDEAYDLIAKSLANVEDPAKRAALAADLLGKSALGVDWVKYAADLDGVKAKYDAMTPSLLAAADASDKLALSMKTFGTYVTGALGNILSGDLFKKFGQGLNDIWEILQGKLTPAQAIAFSEMEAFAASMERAATKAAPFVREIKEIQGL
jgi:hypothetical protein